MLSTVRYSIPQSTLSSIHTHPIPYPIHLYSGTGFVTSEMTFLNFKFRVGGWILCIRLEEPCA